MRRRLLPRVVMAAVFLGPTSAWGQHYGQWGWQGSLGISGRRFENRIDGADAGIYDQRDLRLSLGIDGFLLHPALAGFHLGLDTILSTYRGGLTSSTRSLGGEAELNLLPFGSYPVRLFASRQQFSYGTTDSDDPLALLGLPGTATRFGGRGRIRSGLLNGLALGFDRATTEHVDPAYSADVDEEEFADWARAGRKLVHHYRVERRKHVYGAVDYSSEDLTGTIDEHGALSDRWRWDLTGVGIQRTLQFAGSPAYRIESATVANRLVRTTRGGDALDLAYSFGILRSDITSQSHTLLARYAWRVTRNLDIAPALGYSYQESAGASAQTPEAGLGASWRGRPGPFDLLLNGGLRLGQISSRSEGVSSTSSFLGLAGGFSLGHGSATGLREELQVSASRNAIRRAGDHALPDLGASLGGVGTENVLAGRLTVGFVLGRIRTSGYGEWTKRDSEKLAAASYSVSSSTGSLSLDAPAGSLLVNAGSSRTEQTVSQELTYFSTALTVRPLSFLALRGAYRRDVRHLALGPSLDGYRVEAGGELRVGAFILQAQGFQTSERTERFDTRRDRGLLWSLGRRFGGLLPIVTGPRRRGVIQ